MDHIQHSHNMPRPKGKNNHPLRAIVMENNGAMSSLWLPEEVEGCYYFTDQTETDRQIPIYVLAVDGKWVAVCGEGGYFDVFGQSISSRVVVYDQILLRAIFSNAEFIFYAEKEDPEDHIFIPYYIEPHSDITIGSLEDNDICYPNKFVSRSHAMLHWFSDEWYIVDLGSRNGIYLNGRLVKQQAIFRPGDIVYIMGLYIIMGVGFIALNNKNSRVLLRGPKIRPIQNQNDVVFGQDNILPSFDTIYERQPRRSYKIEPDAIEIESPPMKISANKVPFLLRMGNPAVSGGRAIMSGNILSAVTSMVLPFVTQGLTEKDRKDYDAKRTAFYSAYIENKRVEILEEVTREETTLNSVYPDLSEALKFPIERNRLWERRKFDSDFLSVRIGYGEIPLIAKKEFQKRRFEIERDAMTERMYDLAEKKTMLHDVPIMLSLRDDYVIGVKGKQESKLQFVSNMIMQLALTHSYDELKIVLLANKEDIEQLDFVRYLPHNWDNEMSIRFFGSSRSDAQAVSKYLNTQYDKITSVTGKIQQAIKTNPAFVIFCLDKELYECVEVFKTVQESENYYGFSLITVFDNVPKECSKLISLYETPEIIDLFHPEENDQSFTLDAAASDTINEGINSLKSTKLKLETQDAGLPTMITFLEMYNVGIVEHLNPLNRWSENNPVKSLAAPVGVGTDGKLFTLDLHEKRQGPHGLIAGGTGSGKSEFIITYILSMAVNFSPDEVAFVLIDYKGGGLADAFVDEKRGIHLPHVVGTITNLDGASIQRSLMSINSELKRRQAVFSRAKSETNEGTMDIYDYQKLYRNKRVKEPMPHLFIISDEFAELKKQQPEFMDELISTARIGRSLGVHLILATQKPSGVVNDQIWSNTKFRVCLRVADKSDSMEMLKRPEAAEIRNTGRFYLQVGYNEYFAQGQSAWCGADYSPQEKAVVKQNDTVRFIDNVGQTILTSKPHVEKKPSEGKQIVAIVQYLSDLAKREGIVPGALWKDPLPDAIELEDLMQENPVPEGNGITAMIGMIDDPEHQSQYPFQLDMQSFRNMLVCGNSGSGKSTLIRTMLTSLILRYSPDDVNYYILDLSGGALFGLAKAPHCGAYLNENNEADFFRLIKMIQDIVAERKKMFAEAEVTSFEAYRQIKNLPLIILIIDGFTNINNFRRGTEFYSDLYVYLREFSGYGIRTIVSINHLNEIHSKARQDMDYSIALQAKDRYEYQDILGVRTTFTIPSKNGRGVCVYEGRPLEYHVAMLNAELSEQDRAQALKDRLAKLSSLYESIPPVKSLPMANDNETYEEFYKGFKDSRIPLGYILRDMKKTAIPFKQLHSISIYFGNPVGIRPVLDNILFSAKQNGMELIIIKKASESIFSGVEQAVEAQYPYDVTFIEPSLSGLQQLQERLVDEIVKRNVFRDEYCEEHGIPSSDAGRIKKAETYIKENTTPILVLFEGFGDICRLERTEEIQTFKQVYEVFFGKTKGYNIYFTACFYPEDENVRVSPFMKNYNQQHFALLFGGKYSRQCVIENIPLDLRRIDKIEPRYDLFIMNYRDELYNMRMPCGELQTGTEDPDDVAIV